MVFFMPDKEVPKDDSDGEDEWMSYANAGFGATDYSLWDEDEKPAELIDEEDFDDLQLDTVE